MNVRAWLAPGPPIVPFPPKTEPCGRIDVFVPPNGEGDAPGALKAFGCVLVPKGELVVEAPNAEGEATGAPKGDAGAAPKAPAGLPNAPGLLPPPKAPPPPKPAENVMLSGTRASKCVEIFELVFFSSKYPTGNPRIDHDVRSHNSSKFSSLAKKPRILAVLDKEDMRFEGRGGPRVKIFELADSKDPSLGFSEEFFRIFSIFFHFFPFFHKLTSQTFFTDGAQILLHFHV